MCVLSVISVFLFVCGKKLVLSEQNISEVCGVSRIPGNCMQNAKISSVSLEWFKTIALCSAETSTSLVPVLYYKHFIG